MADRTWTPTYRCAWCKNEFTQRMVDGVNAWVCPTDECYERQSQWKILDINKKLFYLPMPRLVEVEEAIASQQYGAICLGGDRSGGKSVGLRRLIYRYGLKLQDFTAILLRRNFPELELNHMRFVRSESERLGLNWSEQKKVLTFPETGATVRFGHCHRPADFEAYIGADVDLIMFGQLEEFTQQQFVEISPSTGRIRRDDWRGLVLAEENPGGPLSQFVKEFFIDKNPNHELFPNYAPEDHCFIKSELTDNPYTDPRYVHRLANLSPTRREMMRFGNREVWPGQFFGEFKPEKHVSQS